MSDIAMSLWGILLDWSVRNIQDSDLGFCPRFEFQGHLYNTEWERYRYCSSSPLMDEETALSEPSYYYPIIIRRSGSRMLFMSIRRDIVEHILIKELPHIFSPPLQPIRIEVDKIVRFLSQNPLDYHLSFAHARVPAYGKMLRSVSFYGESLVGAAFFTEHINLMRFFTCGLKKSEGGPEIVRVGGKGTVSFFLSGSQRIIEVEKALGFLRTHGFFKSPFMG